LYCLANKKHRDGFPDPRNPPRRPGPAIPQAALPWNSTLEEIALSRKVFGNYNHIFDEDGDAKGADVVTKGFV